MGIEDEGPAPEELGESWIPDWADVSLHERALEEVEVVEAMFPDECKVLTPSVQKHLEQCVRRGSVSARQGLLEVEVKLALEPAQEEGCLIVKFGLPPYYPMMKASI